MLFSLLIFSANFSALPSFVSRISVQRPKVKRTVFLLKNLPKYHYFIKLKAQLHCSITFWIIKIFPKIFLKFLKNLVGVYRWTCFKPSFVKNWVRIQYPSWSHFLFYINVAFIWCALRSQQMLSFHTGAFLNIQLDIPTYFIIYNSCRSTLSLAPNFRANF